MSNPLSGRDNTVTNADFSSTPTRVIEAGRERENESNSNSETTGSGREEVRDLGPKWDDVEYANVNFESAMLAVSMISKSDITVGTSDNKLLKTTTILDTKPEYLPIQ
jgi:hypothetical protein